MKDIQLKWYSIPPFTNYNPVDLYGKEYGHPPQLIKCEMKNLHVLARAKMDIKKKIGDVIIRITADDYYKLYINGEYVGQGPAAAYPESYYYNEVNITRFLKPGINIFAVHLYYQGLINRVWNSGDGRFGVAAQVEQDNRKKEDLAWRYTVSEAFQGDVTGYDTQYTENFDGKKWIEDWNKTTYDDKSWKEMELVKNSDYIFCLQTTKMLDIYIRKPFHIKIKNNIYDIDMGEEITGALKIYATGKLGDKITIHCGEERNADGIVRWNMRCNCKYKEVWLLKDGKNVFEPYDYKGFRYAQIIIDGDAVIDKAEAVIRHYPMDDVCTLKCSDQYLEKIFRICRNGVKYGTQESYLDCPTREKGQYLGDAIVTSLSQVWLTGSVEMLRKCIDQFAQTSKICPGLMAVAPGNYMQEIADFSLLWPELLRTDYKFTGDKLFLRKYYSIARSMIKYFEKYKRNDGLLVQVSEKWNIVDWPEEMRDNYDVELERPLTSNVCHNVINALYLGAVKSLRWMEEVLELPYSYDFHEMKHTYIQTFYSTEKCLFKDSEISQHTSLHSNIYALYFDLCPAESKNEIAEFLISKGLACGVLLSYFYLKALAKTGRNEDVYQIIVNKTRHGWVNMIKEGATTCWEAWGKEQKWNTSFCHPWASAPIPVIIEDIAGFNPNPNFKKGFIFNPNIPDIIKQFILHFKYRGKHYCVRKKQGETKLLINIGTENESDVQI